MTVYKVHHTIPSLEPISINEQEIDNSTALTLFGRKRLAYGKELNQNLLRLLESFSCPELASSDPAVPDLDAAADPTIFANPIPGQMWFNSTPTKELLNVWNGTIWVPQARFGDIAANWGVIASGGQIPLPVSPSGRTYDYSECSWIVSPYGYPNTIDYMQCFTDESANVTMEYSLEGSASIVAGLANYIIVAIPDNVNVGELLP